MKSFATPYRVKRMKWTMLDDAEGRRDLREVEVSSTDVRVLRERARGGREERQKRRRRRRKERPGSAGERGRPISVCQSWRLAEKTKGSMLAVYFSLSLSLSLAALGFSRTGNSVTWQNVSEGSKLTGDWSHSSTPIHHEKLNGKIKIEVRKIKSNMESHIDSSTIDKN